MVAAHCRGGRRRRRALQLERAVGGRAQLYRATLADGDRAFVKVYGQDSRDADLLYRGYRTLLLREAGDERPASSLAAGVEHEALLLVLARRAGVALPRLRGPSPGCPTARWPLAMDDIAGRPLDDHAAARHRRRLAGRRVARGRPLHARRASPIGPCAPPTSLVADDGRPSSSTSGFGEASASPRLRAIDRAELLASLAALVGPAEAVASAARVLDPTDLAAAMPYLQPLALSAATRKRVSKSALTELRNAVAEATGEEPLPLERLDPGAAPHLVMIVTLTGAFYILLPQLANVDDSFEAPAVGQLGVAAVRRGDVRRDLRAVGLSAMLGSVPAPLPFLPTVRAQLASSFVNRVTPANVGGMALNVRFMQKAGVEPAQAVTGVGLDVLAGGDRPRRRC